MAAASDSMAALIGAQSPLAAGRSLVALVTERPEGLGDLTIRSRGVTTSYRVGPTYRVRTVPPWLHPDWVLQDSPMGVLVLVLFAVLPLSAAAFGLLRRRANTRTG